MSPTLLIAYRRILWFGTGEYRYGIHRNSPREAAAAAAWLASFDVKES